MLTIPRGNSYSFKFEITYEDKTPYILSSTEQVVFSVKRSTDKSEEAFIQKIYTGDDCDEDNKLTIKIEPEDTINIRAGDYWFDIAVFDGDDFFTVIKPCTLKITPALGDKEVFVDG